MNSRDKGKRGEREWAEECRKHGYLEARRGVQFAGGADSPDVVGLPGFHCEVKRTENLSVYKAMEQSEHDSAGRAVPLVAHRRNNRPWLVVLRAEDFFRLIAKEPNDSSS